MSPVQKNKSNKRSRPKASGGKARKQSTPARKKRSPVKPATKAKKQSPFERRRSMSLRDWEGEENEWLKKEERRRARRAKPSGKRPWGLSRIEKHKLTHFHALCGKSEFNAWLAERERSAEDGDWGAIIELVNVDFAYVQKHRGVLELWRDMAADSSLARGYLESAFEPARRRKRRSVPFRTELLKNYYLQVLKRGEVSRYEAAELTRDWWEDLTGEHLTVDNLRDNILLSTQKPVQLHLLQPFQAFDELASLFRIDTRVLRPQLTIYWDKCDRRCKHWIRDWRSWKRTLRFRDHRDACLEFWALFDGVDPHGTFKTFIREQDKLVEGRPESTQCHCMRRLYPRFYHVPCPCETALSGWMRDPRAIVGLTQHIQQTIERIPQSQRLQWLSSL